MSFRRGAVSIGLGNATSKALGVLREMLFAYALGTTRVADSFRLALSLVLIPTQFATGELTMASVVPVLRRTWLVNGAESRRMALRLLWSLFGFGILVTVVVITGRHRITKIFAPGFDATSRIYASSFLGILGLAAPLYAVGAAAAMVGIAAGRFTLTAVKPIVRNLGLLGGLLLFLEYRHEAWLAWGFVIGYVAFSMGGILATRRLVATPAAGRDNASVAQVPRGEIAAQMRALGVLVALSQCALLAERVITTFAGVGAIAAIDYARFITETPTLLLAMPAAVAALSKFAPGEWAEHREVSARLLRATMYATAPIAVGAATAGPLLVTIVFERGAFGSSSAKLVTEALLGSALGIITGSVAYLIQRIFSARRRNRELLFGLTASSVLSLSVAMILVRSWGVLAIGLASSLGQGVYAAWGIRQLGLWKALRVAPIACAVCVGGGTFAVVHWTGLDGWSMTATLMPAVAALGCILSFRSVREDLAWAVPGRHSPSGR